VLFFLDISQTNILPAVNVSAVAMIRPSVATMWQITHVHLRPILQKKNTFISTQIIKNSKQPRTQH